MNVYSKLDAIDAFEQKFGEREAATRACDLMVSYLAEVTTPLSPIAEHGVIVGTKYKDGLASATELAAERETLAHALRERGWTNYDTPETCALHAVYAIISLYVEPSWGGGASEAVSNFWDVMEKVDRNEALLTRLLKQCFP